MALENGKVGIQQFFFFTILATIGDTILVLPSALTTEGKRDAWISGLLSVGIGMLIILLYNAMRSRYPDKTLVEYSEIILGKWLGRIVSILFTLVFLTIVNAAVLREIGDFMTIQIMPNTPDLVIMVFFLSIVVMGVRLGLEPIVRTAEIMFPWVVILLSLLIFLSIPGVDLIRLKPVLAEGIKPVLRASYPFVSFPFMEHAAFLMILPYVTDKHKIRNKFLLGTFIGGMLLVLVTTLCILVLGDDITARSIYPTFVLAKRISVGHFIERLESIMMISWFLTLFVKMSLFLYGATLGVAQVFQLRDYRPLALPLGMIVLAYSFVLTPNIIHYNNFLLTVYPIFTFHFSILLPLLLLTVDKLRNKFG